MIEVNCTYKVTCDDSDCDNSIEIKGPQAILIDHEVRARGWYVVVPNTNWTMYCCEEHAQNYIDWWNANMGTTLPDAEAWGGEEEA